MLIRLSLLVAVMATAVSADRFSTKTENIRIKSFGKTYTDPYRWLEELGSIQTTSFIEDQNQITQQYLSNTNYGEIYTEIFDALTKEKEAQNKTGDQGLQFTERENRLQHFAPNTQQRISSPSGKYQIISSSATGSDLRILRVRDTSSGLELPDTLVAKFASWIWIDDASFIYTSTGDGRVGSRLTETRIHQLGTSQSEDELILKSSSYSDWYSFRQSDNGELFLVRDSDDELVIEQFYLETRSFREYARLGNNHNRWLLDVNFDEHVGTFKEMGGDGFGSIVRIDLKTGQRTVLVPDQGHYLDSVSILDDKIYFTLVVDTESKLHVLDRTSGEVDSIPLPYPARARISHHEGEVHISLSSYSKSHAIFRLQTTDLTLVHVSGGGNLEVELSSEKVFYRASTPEGHKEAPIWIVKQADTELTENTPVYLYGYGGFSINLLPSHWSANLPWLKRGGVVAIVTLPGGLEYGETWHQGGALLNKHHVFKSFANAGKRLIELGMTSKDHLAIGGGSNGGLLVGATLNMYPNLFAAAVPEVGVMDMVRFDRYTGGRYWIREYGDPSLREDFRNLFSYSPYHQLKKRDYPAVLVLTADQDDRVVPSHSYKYAARLQAFQKGPAPILLHTKRGGSHGSRSGSISERAKYQAAKWAFLLKELK